MEKFYGLQQSITAHLPGAHNWLMTNGAKFHSNQPNLVEEIKRVWLKMRYDHPLICAEIDGDRISYTSLADEAEVEQWLKDSFFVHNVDQTSRQIYPSLPTRPLKSSVLHFLPRTQELIFMCPHSHSDGLGIVTFFDNFFKELVKGGERPAFGDEGKNLLPPLTPIAHIPKYTPAQQSRWDASISDWLADHPTVRVKTEQSDLPGKSTMMNLRFTEEDTQKILKACKAHNITVTSAGQAAVTHAARIHGNCEDKDSVSTIALYDAREYISPKVRKESLIGPHTFATPVKIRLGSFLETARNTREIFVREKEDRYALTMSQYYTKEFPRLLRTPPAPGKARPLPSNAHMSSLGRIDSLMPSKYEGPNGTVGFTDIWLALDIMTPDILTAMWTLGGRLNMHLDYNEAFHPEASMVRYLEIMRDQMAKGLGIELGGDIMLPGDEGYLKRGNYQALHRTHEY